MVRWEQKGFVVVSQLSESEEAPCVHAFVRTKLEAAVEKSRAEELPEELRVKLRVVPAILKFDIGVNGEK